MNITQIEVETIDGSTVTYVIIDRGNGEYTSMTKAYWDEQQAQKELGGTL